MSEKEEHFNQLTLSEFVKKSSMTTRKKLEIIVT